MADAKKKLADAGLKNIDKLPVDKIDALASLSPAELAALAKAQQKLKSGGPEQADDVIGVIAF